MEEESRDLPTQTDLWATANQGHSCQTNLGQRNEYGHNHCILLV